jgi:hypothetical protein
MKRVMFTAALLSMVLAGASLAPKASAQTSTLTITESVPLNTSVYNPCNGQVVALSGVLHASETITQTPTGTLNIVQHLDWSKVKGTDLFRNSYVVHNADSDFGDLRISGNGGQTLTFPQSLTFGQSFALVTTGSAPNFRVNELFHVTANANGSVTSFVDSFTTNTCPTSPLASPSSLRSPHGLVVRSLKSRK